MNLLLFYYKILRNSVTICKLKFIVTISIFIDKRKQELLTDNNGN